MNGFRKVTSPDEELKIIVFSPFVLPTSTKYYGFSLLEVSKGLLLVCVEPDFPPVEFSLTLLPSVDLDFSLTDFAPSSSETVPDLLACYTLCRIPWCTFARHCSAARVFSKTCRSTNLLKKVNFEDTLSGINYHPHTLLYQQFVDKTFDRW
jgi:hypothetical protein